MSDGRTAPLITSKYSIPPIRPGAVPRTRLHEQLANTSHTPLTTVIAPAGWGKSTALAQWANSLAESRSIVWVSLDKSDDEPVRFWTYVMTALTSTVQGLSDEVLKAVLTAGTTPVDLALPTLLNELDALTSRSVLVLDDYHLLENPMVHEGVEFLLGYLPPSLRIAIAGRFDPPLPLARMRGRGELTEIRAAELRFDDQEATALLSAVTSTTFDASEAAELCKKTEGWATGLQLAGLAIRGSTDPIETAAALRGDDRHILDYLSSEVLDRIPIYQRQLLVRTAVLERLCGPLCDAVLDKRGSAEELVDLERRDMFVTALDARRRWFRCHGLLRDLLLRELEAHAPESATVVLSRAADWFLEQGYLADAVDLWIQAGNQEAAAALLRSQVMWFIGHGAAGTHLQLGERLPRAGVLQDPELCISLAWTAAFTGQHASMRPWLDAAEPFIGDETLAAEGWASLRGAAMTMRARYHGTAGADESSALRDAREAVQLETDPNLIGYVVSRTVLGLTLTNSDKSSEALPYLQDAWAQARAQGLPPLGQLQTASALAGALLDTDRLDQLRRLLRDVAPTIAAGQEQWGAAVGPGFARLRMVQGQLAHRDGDITGAYSLLRKSVELARIFGEPTATLTALLAMAELEHAQHDSAAARITLTEARELVDSEHVPRPILDRLHAMERRVGRAISPSPRADHLLDELTERERAVLSALAGDDSQREIGAALFLSINTVKGYTKAVYRKLGVGTRQDAVRRGRSLGLL